MSHGPSSIVVGALERTWAEMRDRHPDVPEVVFVTGKGSKKMEVKWGHWCPDRWQESDARNNSLPEVFISGECMAQGAAKVLETLLHEAAHGLAWVRDIKDTSRGNRYHNQKFVSLAEELGLRGPEVADEVRGWSACRLAEGTVDSYVSLPALAEALVVCIGPKLDEVDPDKAKPPTERKPQPKYGCGCPERIIRIPKKVLEIGPILCGLCDQAFLEVIGA